MATSSIFSNIAVDDKKSCERVIDAMENAVKAQPKKVKLSRPVSEMSEDKIKEVFGAK